MEKKIKKIWVAGFFLRTINATVFSNKLNNLIDTIKYGVHLRNRLAIWMEILNRIKWLNMEQKKIEIYFCVFTTIWITIILKTIKTETRPSAKTAKYRPKYYRVQGRNQRRNWFDHGQT